MDKTDLLKEEYFHLQAVTDSFDQRALSIKAWSVSLSAAIAAFAAEEDWPLIVIALSALLFWLIEGLWKSFQQAYFVRTRELESFFAGETQDVVPLQISRSWYEAWRKGGWKQVYRILRWPHVALPHVGVALIATAVYIIRVAT